MPCSPIQDERFGRQPLGLPRGSVRVALSSGRTTLPVHCWLVNAPPWRLEPSIAQTWASSHFSEETSSWLAGCELGLVCCMRRESGRTLRSDVTCAPSDIS